jgi:hypothetical protein
VAPGRTASLKERLADRQALDTLIVGGEEGSHTRDGETGLRDPRER